MHNKIKRDTFATPFKSRLFFIKKGFFPTRTTIYIMKKLYSLLLIAALCLLSQTAMAAIDGFVTEDSDKSIIHNGVTYDEGKAQTPGSNAYTGDIEIPEGVTTLKNKTVGFLFWSTQVGTFQYSTITSASLPASLTEIQQGAFSDCPLLQEINVHEDNEDYMSIDGCVYKYTTVNGEKVPTTLVFVPGGKSSVNIDSRITSIADCAFDGCTNIKEVTIPAGVTSIGKYAFTGCNLDRIICNATTPPEVTGDSEDEGWGFQDLAVTEIIVPSSAKTEYEDSPDWGAFANQLKVAYLEISAEVISYKELNSNGVYEVVRIEVINITGKNNEVFAAAPEGWTMTDSNGNSYSLTTALTNSNKTVKVTMIDIPTEWGDYTLNIPAGSLKSEDGTECQKTQRRWTIQAPEYEYKEETASLTLKIHDTDTVFKWSYTNDEGTLVESSEPHTVGSMLYKKDNSSTVGNVTTITTTYYNSANAEYSRTFANNNWQALYVPFDLVYNASWDAIFEVGKITHVTDYYDTNNNVVWFYVTVDILGTDDVETFRIPANTPALIRSKHSGDAVTRTFSVGNGNTIAASADAFEVESSNGNKYSFTGNYKKQNSGEIAENIGEDFGSIYAMSGGQIKNAGNENVALRAYRWFMTIKENPSLQSDITFSYGKFNGEETDIPEVRVQVFEKDLYYDLSGRRVDNPSNGIYIINGRKVFVK